MLTNGWEINERSEENGMHSLNIYINGQLVDKITSGSLRWLSSIANNRYAVAFRTQNETIHAQPNTTKDIEVQETLETAKELDVLPHKATMMYEEAKEYKQLLEDKNKADGKALKVFDQYRNAMGIVPDHIRELPEYKKAKESCDKSFSKLREFNAFFVKNFKKEYAVDRKNRNKAK